MVLTSNTVFAQNATDRIYYSQTEGLSLTEIVKRAFENNSEIKIAKAGSGKSQGPADTRRQAGGCRHNKLRDRLAQTEGIAEVHDLHVWSLTSGVNALSVHAVLADDAEHDDVLERVHGCRTMEFKISHVTAQTERVGFVCHETHL